MSVEQKSELESFHAFVAEQLANGGTHVSPEQVLVFGETVSTLSQRSMKAFKRWTMDGLSPWMNSKATSSLGNISTE